MDLSKSFRRARSTFKYCISFLVVILPVILIIGTPGANAQTSPHIDFTYGSSSALTADGWSFLARTSTGSDRNTEQTTGLVVSYDQTAHPGVIRIPADQGSFWGGSNNTRNTLFRDLPGDWTTIRLGIAAFAPTAPYQGACLSAYQDDDNYVILCRDNVGSQTVEWWQEGAGNAAVIGSLSNSTTTGLRIRLDRVPATNTLTAFISANGGSSWTQVPGSVVKALTNPRLGVVVGGNNSASFPPADLAFVEIGSQSAPLPPSIGFSPASLSFTGTEGGANPAAQNLSVSNTESGSGPLNWTVADNQPWLSVSPGSGTAPSTLSVSVDTAGLAAGTHNGTITITAAGASNSPRTVPVSLILSAAAQPVLTVSPASLNFLGTMGEANPASQNLSITNAEVGALNWTASDNQTWLSVTPSSGTTPGTLSVSVNVAGLTAGTYTGTVTVASNGAIGSPQTIAVTFKVRSPYVSHVDLNYLSRSALMADGWWDFLARTPAGGARDTEQTTGLVVSYNQSLHPGVIRIPSDQGTLWGSPNNTRNTLFRDLPSDWTTIRLAIPAFSPTNPFQGACLAAYQDDDNYVIFCRDHVGWQVLEWWQENAGSAAVIGSVPSNVTTGLRLRLDRNPSTNALTAFVSTDGATWVQMPGSVVKALNNPRLALIVSGNNSTSSYPAADLAYVDIGSVSVPLPPGLGVSANSLSFTATQGGSNPTGQSLGITNTESGSGPLNWSATDNQPWLSVSPGSGTAPSTLNVNVNMSGLAVGAYTGTVTVSAPGALNAPRNITVTFKVRAPYTPYIDLNYASRAALLADGWWDFLARPAAGGFRDTEQTTGKVVSYDQGLHPGVIRIPADQGTLWGSVNNSRNTLFRDLPNDWTTVRLDIPAFAPAAPFQGACLAAYQDDDNYVMLCRDHVGWQVLEWWQETGGNPAGISSQPSNITSNLRLRLDRNPSTNAITAFFSTNGGLTWTQAPGSVVKAMTSPRLAIVVGGDASGTSSPPADIAFVQVGSQSVPLPATIGVSPISLNFTSTEGGTNPSAQNVSIVNTEAGSGQLNWSVTDNQTWLSVSPGSGTAPSTLSVSVNAAGLAANTYNGTVTITAPGAAGSPKAIPVTLKVRPTPPPHIDLGFTSRNELLADGWWDFLARTPGGSTRDTEQTAGLVVSYDQALHPGMIRIPSDKGTLWGDTNNTRNTLFRDLPTDWTTIRLSVAAFAPTAQYQGACLSAYQDDDNYVILCRDNGGSQVIEWWHETAGSATVLSSQSNNLTTGLRLRLDRNPSTNSITALLSTDGGANWTPMSGSVVKAFTNPRLAIVVGGNNSTTNFPAADLAFVEIGSPSVPLPPALGVSPSSLNFTGSQGGPNPTAQSLSITDTESAGGVMNWTATDNQTWLSVSPGSGTAPGTLNASVNTTGLAVGTYAGTVTITAPGASGSPRAIGVTLTVTAPVPPALAVIPSSLSFTGIAGGSNPAPRTLDITNSGGGIVNWTAADDRTWLSVSPGSGTAPSTANVSVSIAGLAVGTYNGSITVTAPGASGSPKVVPVSLSIISLTGAGVMTAAVLVNSSNPQGYNTNPSSPGEFQLYPERYLQHLQIPYEIINVAAASPPSDLPNRHLIIAGHRGLNLSAAWRNGIASAVNGGAGFVNLDWDTQIGSQSHIQTIFGATGSEAGAPGSSVVVPASVVPGGASPHYIAALQRRFLGDPGGDIVYDFYRETVESTILTGSPATVIARIQNDPLIVARSYGSGRAVHFGTLEYLNADRFGFLQGVDDLFWRSLVWAAKKPFVARGYERLLAIQMDDTNAGWAGRVRDLYDTAYTGNVGSDGTGGPWKITGYVFTSPSLPPGSGDRASVITDINAGKLQIVPHDFNGVNCGEIYWNGCTGALTDSQWLSNLNAIAAWKTGLGGADTIPQYSRALVGHWWNISNNTGYDLWNLGFRYVTGIQNPGYQLTFSDPMDKYNGAERPSARPFWLYSKPTKFTRNEDFPLFFADNYTVGSRQGLPSRTFFLFATQFHFYGEPRPDFTWPSQYQTVAQSVDQFKKHTWRFLSSLAPMQMFTHDASNYELSSLADRRAVIQQVSAWLSTEKVRHVFMENMGDYVYARNKSVLTQALLSGGFINFTFTGNAATADGALINTHVTVFLGDDEGSSRTIPGFTGGSNVTIPVIP